MSGGLGNMIKQAQAMQEKMKQAQQELADTEVRGQSGGGLVAITMTCQHDARKLEISPALMQDEREVLEDLIVAAINDATRKIEQVSAEKMSGLKDMSGLNIPGLKLPF